MSFRKAPRLLELATHSRSDAEGVAAGGGGGSGGSGRRRDALIGRRGLKTTRVHEDEDDERDEDDEEDGRGRGRPSLKRAHHRDAGESDEEDPGQ